MFHPRPSSSSVVSILLGCSLIIQSTHPFSSKACLKNTNGPVPTELPSSVLFSTTTSESLPELKLFNSLSRSKEVFQSLTPNKVTMYTCGPTVYDYAHVGNFRAFLTYDLVKRVLLYFGYDVEHICNLTDVDDKIINRANEQGLPNGKISELTLRFEDYFFEDLKALNVLLANQYPRATEHIPEMMEMILELAKKDLAYETEDGSWYFATANKEGYGERLVQLNRDEMESQQDETAVGKDMKRDSADFALWKAYKEAADREDATWEHPQKLIQKGRPGWHLECSAMSRKYLGDTIDIHGGGCDLQFPHHENEIAQSEGVTGKPFCNYWVHNGFVNINEEKMSKSLGNFLTLRTACPKAVDVRAFRFFVMSSQYQKQLGFTPQAMDASRNALKRIDRVMEQIERVLAKDEPGEDSSDLQSVVVKAMENFELALLDDLSMPRASASLFSLVKAAEQEFKKAKQGELLDRKGLEDVKAALLKMDTVFGIFYEVPHDNEEETTEEAPKEVMELVHQRTNAKEAKDWELADSLRARITELGFAVKDVKGGDPIVTKLD